MNRIQIGLGVLAVLMCGCASSSPPRYYTLDMRPSGSASTQYNIDVDRLRPAEALARTDILIEKSPTEIEYYARDRWAAGLSELVGEKLESELGPDLDGRATIIISGRILAFGQADTADGAGAHIKLDIELRLESASRHDKALFEKTYEKTMPAGGKSPSAVVTALSQGLEMIAREIAADVNGL